jgi:hypothetical protein
VRLLKLAQSIVAVALVVAGVAFWSIPAALIVAGVFLLVDLLTD